MADSTVNRITASVLGHLHGAATYDVTAPASNDPKYDINRVIAECLRALKMVLATIAKTKGHPDLEWLGTDSALLANAASVQSIQKEGPFVSCRVSFTTPAPSVDDATFKPAKQIDAEDVRFYVADQTTFTLTLPWYVYALEAGYIYHGGTRAILRYVAEPDASTLLTTAFDKYINAAVWIALASLLPFMGRTDTAAGHYYGMAREALRTVAEGQAMAPPPQG